MGSPAMEPGHEDAMPLYEYRCEACGTQEEKLEPISAPDRHACPECEAPDGMRRQVSVAAFALSGGGWYKEGYGGGRAPAAKPEGGADTPAAAPEKSEKPAAPAAKAEAAPAKPAGGCGGGCACHP